jgi:autotransporter-associated beta strand protein
MKAKRITMRWSLPMLAGILTLSSAYGQQASTTLWDVVPTDPITPGDWAVGPWTAGVPAADSLAGILNGDTVGVAAPTAILEQLHLANSSTLNLGALLEVAGTNGVPAVIDPPTPAIPATGVIVNAGTLNVNAGGDLRVNTGGDFVIGKDATGLITLATDGTITTDRSLTLGTGATGNGTFTQTGGTLTSTAVEFKVGGSGIGLLNISDGTFNVDKLRVAFGGAAAGTVNQSGGDLVANGDGALSVGWDGSAGANGTYNLSGGTITTNHRMRIGIGANGPRTHLFNQTGGDVSVTGGATPGNGRIDIGENAANTSTYAISDGSLTTTARVLCGAHSTGTGILNMSGLANVNLFGLFVGNNATNTGTVNVSGEAQVIIGEFEVRNGSVTQSGESSDLFVNTRFYVGTAITATQTATFTLTDGELYLPGTNIIGNLNPGNATLNIDGGILTTTNRLRVGIGKADATLTPTNLVNQTGGSVSITGRLDIGEFPGPTNIYQISGGSLTTTQNILVGYWSDGAGTFTVSGTAEVDTPSVVMGENAGVPVNGAEGTVNLNGGILTTNQIKVGLGFTANQTLNLNGGTIRAKTDGSVLISGNVTTASLLSGGVTFEVPDMTWTCSTAAVMTGPGGLTKMGPGTLTVDSVQAYSGATKAQEGTLRLTEPYLADNGDVYLYTGAILQLDHSGTDDIGTLYIDDVPQQVGTYGGTGTVVDTVLDELMAGTGVLNATSSGSPAEAPVITSITVSGATATIAISGAPSTTYVCKFSNDLVTPFELIPTDPATVTTNGSGAATFTVDASVAKRFYIVGEE